MADDDRISRDDVDECVIDVIHADEKYLSQEKNPDYRRRDIRQYMGITAPDETVTHLEKVTSEVVYGNRYDVWDVHTDKGRWWVITNLTNLYSQSMFPSMDMCLTFHIGFMARMMGTDAQPDEIGDSILRVGRILRAASDSFERAEEVEDLQAVGVKLREGLLCFVREFAKPEIVPEGREQPKVGDFIHWIEAIVDWLTPNSNLGRIRLTLKAFARDTWQMINNLAHSTSADKTQADVCVQSAQHLLNQFATLIKALEHEPQERCPRCGSLRLFIEYRIGDIGRGQNITICEVCGWEAERT